MNIALFDFDGTITEIDTYTPFIHFSVPKWRIIICYPFLLPLILLYKRKLMGGSTIRTIISRLGFYRRKQSEVFIQGQKYAATLNAVIKPEAKKRLEWHKQQGDLIVVVSASLDAYLIPWCTEHNVELICAQLESRDGLLTGRYINGDCSAHEKAHRVKQRYRLSSFDKVYAYGDTEEDSQLLALADEAYFCWNKMTA
ncbi:HAD-IB family hydrolase [Shewanella olleyana]|uniref:HAD-IB family hydrolase n=1 Tax=Shewanella olleyana TaxID=135626 RepID=UPI00200BF92E|nr:HAD-IB family hydrolase [Shewanella olleyana]MCL1065411.1 HAD-IB family hydrolase [Shewanella olleyana]